MRFRDMAAMAFGNLFKRRVRTALTVSGVIIGTCAIIVMLSLGIGMKQSMETMMQGMGDLTVITINNRASGSAEAQALDDRELDKIRQIPNVVTLTPIYYLSNGNVTVSCGKYQFQGMIYGVYMDSLAPLGYKAENGSLPGENAQSTDILFGSNAAYDFVDSKKGNSVRYAKMMGGKGEKAPDPFVDLMTDRFQLTVNLPEGSTAKNKPVKLNISGTLAEDWSKNPGPSDCIFMDVGYAKELMEKYNKLNDVKTDTSIKPGYDSAVVKVDSIDSVAGAEQAIKDMGFDTYSMDSMRKPVEEQMRNVQMILGGLGAISLLVAALGITNTMIMSIYERTREIGIMKVLGCVVRNIRTMFLMEAAAIGFLGGGIGIGLSYGISYAINMFAAQSAANGNASGGGILGIGGGTSISVIPLWLALGALAFATLVGLVSGFHPANRAVKISALTAIKQE